MSTLCDICLHIQHSHLFITLKERHSYNRNCGIKISTLLSVDSYIETNKQKNWIIKYIAIKKSHKQQQ